MIYFDSKYTINNGNTVSDSPKYTEPYSSQISPPQADHYRIVNLHLSVSRINGISRLFQLATNEKIACVAMAGFIIGKIIMLNV